MALNRSTAPRIASLTLPALCEIPVVIIDQNWIASQNPQIASTARIPQNRGQASRSLAPSTGIGPSARMQPCHGAAEDAGSGQSQALVHQRFAIITLYSLAILLVMGYVPGLGL